MFCHNQLHATPGLNTLKCYIFMGAMLLAFAPGNARGEAFSGTLDADNMRDEYIVTVPSFGTLQITVTTGPDLNLYGGVFLYDSDGETSFYGTNQGPDSTVTHEVHRLRPGQYTLAIEKDGRSFYFGSYSVNTNVVATHVNSDSEFNDASDSALVLDWGVTASGLLGFRGQQEPDDMEDWYMVNLPSHGDIKLTVTTSGGNDDATGIRYSDGQLNLYGGVFLYDVDGETSFLGPNQGPGATVEYVVNALRPGTYFVRLEIDGRLGMYWGSYTLTAESLPWSRATDPEPNDDFDSATSVPAVMPFTGDLGTRGQGLATDLKDYWIFNHPGGELIYTVRASGGEDTPDSGDGRLNLYGSVSLYNSAREYVYGTNQGPDTERTYNAGEQPAGNYYLLLEKDGRTFYWGTYAVSISSVAIIDDPDNPDDSDDPTGSDSSSPADSDSIGVNDSDDDSDGIGDTNSMGDSAPDTAGDAGEDSATDSGDTTPHDTNNVSADTDSQNMGDVDSTGVAPGNGTDSSTAATDSDAGVDGTDTDVNDEMTDDVALADCGCKIGAPRGGDESHTLLGLLLLTLLGFIRRRFR